MPALRLSFIVAGPSPIQFLLGPEKPHIRKSSSFISSHKLSNAEEVDLWTEYDDNSVVVLNGSIIVNGSNKNIGRGDNNQQDPVNPFASDNPVSLKSPSPIQTARAFRCRSELKLGKGCIYSYWLENCIIWKCFIKCIKLKLYLYL